MNKEFLVIDKSILPDIYEKVIVARNKIESDGTNVSEVCKQLDISRSTYYKFKDKVFYAGEDYGKKAIIAFKTQHERGILSNILKSVAEYSGNVLTINQAMPIHNLAHITIAIDTKDLTVSLNELIERLKLLPYVSAVELIAVE